MPRAERIWFPGAVYHIIQRGNARQDIFKEQGDYVWFLKTLREVKREMPFNLFCYALMGSHYHLTVETLDHHISEIMYALNGTYAARFNTKYKRTGHLFQGRFKGILVDTDNYLMALSRYVHLNPVVAGLAGKPEGYRWSSYRVYKYGKADPLVADERLLGLFEGTRAATRVGYCDFVHDGIEQINGKKDWLAANLRRQRFLGDDEFVARFK